MMRSALSLILVVCAARNVAAQDAPEPAPEPVPNDDAKASLTPAPTPAPAASAPATQAPQSSRPSGPAAAATERYPAWQSARLVLDLELYTQARLVHRAGDDLSELRLDRGEVGARVGVYRDAAAELRLEAIRSASDGGALGVDGNSTVVRVKRAQVVATHGFGELRLDGAIGFTADPWIARLERDYTIKPLSRTGSERLLDWPTSDLAAVAAASYGPVRVAVSAGNGEGLRYPERNTGKTITGVAELVPIATDSLRLGVAAVGRDGSLGVGSIRDRRAGGAITAVTPRARAGAELVYAWGIADRGDAKALLVSAWAEAEPIARAVVAARGASLGYADNGGRQSTFGGAVAVEPWRESANARSSLRFWLAIDRVTTSGAAMPLPGADAGDATVVMLIASILAPYEVN